jgi:hypothetical protein
MPRWRRRASGRRPGQPSQNACQSAISCVTSFRHVRNGQGTGQVRSAQRALSNETLRTPPGYSGTESPARSCCRDGGFPPSPQHPEAAVIAPRASHTTWGFHFSRRFQRDSADYAAAGDGVGELEYGGAWLPLLREAKFATRPAARASSVSKCISLDRLCCWVLVV